MKILNLILVFICFSVSLFAQTTATIDFSTHSGNALQQNFGGYSPEKVLWFDKLYDSAKTLGPLKPKVHRMQLDVNKQGTDGTWIDDGNSQKGVMKIVQHLGGTNFVTINTHPNVKGSDVKMNKFFTSIAQALVDVANGKEIYLELFGEPDLSVWNWYTQYTTFDKFYYEFKFAVQAIAPIRAAHPNLKIGGCGFGLSGTSSDNWYRQFVNNLISDNLVIDFISYHHYFGWKDADWLKTADRTSQVSRFNKAKAVSDIYTATQNGRKVEFIISEFNWANGDWNTAFKTGRAHITYRNCARALESLMYIGTDVFNGVDKIFWAQSIGQWIEGWGESYDYWTFFPFVSWHLFKDNTNFYTYNAAYHAFWMYGQMPDQRNNISFSNDDFLGLASSDSKTNYLIVWNRTGTKKNLTFQFKGLSKPLSNYLCEKYEVNSASFDTTKQFLSSELFKLNELGTLSVEPEATIMLKFTENNCSLQTITFDSIPDKLISDVPFKITAKSSLGQNVLFDINTGPATVKNDTITLTKIAGTVTVKAFHNGDSQYCPASVTRSFKVKPILIPYKELTIPGKIEAEDFDLGGEGIAYHDSDPLNNGGQYRTNERVDIGSGASGYYVGWTTTGEWFEYTVNVSESNQYVLSIPYATKIDSMVMHIEFDDVNKTGSLFFPNAGSWTKFDTLQILISGLTQGTHHMKVVFETGNLSIDFFKFDIYNGVSQMETKENELLIFPNPAGNENVSLYFGQGLMNGEAKVFDTYGKLLWTKHLGEGNSFTLNEFSDFQSGMYYLIIQDDKQVFVKKLILK